MSAERLLVSFVVGGSPLEQVHVFAVPSVGDYVDLGSGSSHKVIDRIWTPLSTADTDCIVVLSA